MKTRSTAIKFSDALEKAGLSQYDFRNLVMRLSGDTPTAAATSRWFTDKGPAPPCAIALLTVARYLTPEQLSAIKL